MRDILLEIKRIYGTGITRIMGGKGRIEEMLDKIFWRHLSHSFSYWISPTENINVEKVLLRYISAHLSEYLAINQTGEFEKNVAPEAFIIPPIREHINTGDILKRRSNNQLYIILNPSCDMVLRNEDKGKKGCLTRNAEKIVLASLIKWNELKALSAVTKDSGKDKKNKLKSYISNSKNRFHYLPPYKDIGGMFIDFELIETHRADEVERGFEKIATISSSFLRNIVARFSQYYARQGQPDFDVEYQVKNLLSS
jgi:hypothetical protein